MPSRAPGGPGSRERRCTDLPSGTAPRAVQRRSHLWTFQTTAQQTPRRPIITGEKGSTCPWRLETREVTVNPRSEKTNQNRQRIGMDTFKTRCISSNYTSLILLGLGAVCKPGRFPRSKAATSVGSFTVFHTHPRMPTHKWALGWARGW